jgi:cysteine-rich repeat protein
MCGNGVPEAGEECDWGPNNDDEQSGACRTDCTAAGCSDGVVDYALGEQCDDGNAMAADGCDDQCQVEVGPSCGDGVLDLADGEQCDDGGMAGGDGCSANCQFEPVGANCGDMALDAGEVCDDGNTANGDSCNPTCNLGNDVTFFLGQVGVPGLLDGFGAGARIDGIGTLAADATHLWLADGGNNVIRRITVASAQITTIAGDIALGTAGDVDAAVGLNARFSGPGSITTDGITAWVGDSGNHKIKAIDITDPLFPVTTVAGSGAQNHADGIGLAAEFHDIRGLTYQGGYVYLLDGTAAVLRRFDPATGDVVTLAGQPYMTGSVDDYGGAALMVSPRYIASDNSGNIYIGDNQGFTIRVYNTTTTWLGTFAGNGTKGYVDGVGAAAQIHRIRGMASDGTSIYWAEQEQQTIRQGIIVTQDVSTLAGQHCGGVNPCAGGYVNGVGVNAQFSAPFGVTFHYPSNSLFVLDSANDVIRRIQ